MKSLIVILALALATGVSAQNKRVWKLAEGNLKLTLDRGGKGSKESAIH